MSIEKKYLKSKEVCKVTFVIPTAESGDAATAFLVGEFNDWDTSSLPMKKLKDGTFKLTVDLRAGQEYQFRYLLDGERWENDGSADKYAYCSFGNCDNSIIQI